MDISSLSSGSKYSAPQSAISAGKTADSLGMAKIQNQGALVSGLLPSASSPGLGSNLDLYAAIGMQTQGLLSRGLASIETANISLGIDMSERFGDSASAVKKDGADADAADGTDASETAAPRYFTDIALTNPGLGGLINSLG